MREHDKKQFDFGVYGIYMYIPLYTMLFELDVWIDWIDSSNLKRMKPIDDAKKIMYGILGMVEHVRTIWICTCDVQGQQ